MLHWIESHGFETIISYMVFAALVGSMPPLPETAGYWERWGYAALHALSMNLRSALQSVKVPIPEEKKE